MSIEIEGVEDLEQKLKEIAPKEIDKAIRKGMRKGLQTHRKQVIQNLKSSLPKAIKRNPKYNDRLVDAVKIRAKNDRDAETGVIYGVIHTMGTRKKGSGTFRTRFFEGGTKERYQKTYNGRPLKKKRYLGKLEPKYFFRQGQEGVQQTVSNEISIALVETIKRLNSQ